MKFDSKQFIFDAGKSFLPPLRLGQHLMNELNKISPDLYNSVPEDVDPFYRNDKIDSFWGWLQTKDGIDI